jgi:hypothetical protein
LKLKTPYPGETATSQVRRPQKQGDSVVATPGDKRRQRRQTTNEAVEAYRQGKHKKMNTLHQTRPEALEIVVAEPVARTPATLSEIVEAARRRGFRLNEIETAANLGELIERGKAEILDPPRLVRRNARKVARYAAV